MSSCFLCECGYTFNQYDGHYISTGMPNPVQALMYMQYFPLIKGSAIDKSATQTNNIVYTDQQHTNNNKQNYVSYEVKRIEFEMTKPANRVHKQDAVFNDYVLIFKIPYKLPIFDFGFFDMKNFMLYKQPECVLGYKIIQNYAYWGENNEKPFKPRQYKIIVDKPFVVGPNDYVGIFYMFNSMLRINASSKVWFDVA